MAPASCGRPRDTGLTLIELLITLAIVAVLAALAYPSFASQWLKSRRAEARTALAGVQQAQERWRANHADYAADLATLGVAPPASGRYVLAITESGSDGYTAVATAVQAQAADLGCTRLSVAQRRGRLVYAADGTASAAACWGH